MSLSKNFRWVLVTNLMVRNEVSVPAHIEPFTFQEIEEILVQKKNAGDVSYSFQNDTRILRIRKILQSDQDYLILLVSVGDKNFSDPSFENFITGEIRPVEREQDEGVSHAAHILIKKEPDDVGNHLMMIEKVPGINVSNLTNFFRSIFNDDNVMREYEEDGEVKKYRPLFEITGHAHQTLREALVTGKLEDIEFVSHRQVEEGHDEHGYVQEQVQEVKFVVKRGITTDTVDGFFGNIVNRFRDTSDYDKMFVRIKTNKGQIRRTEVDLAREDVLSQAFFQSEVINDFSEPLDKTYDDINNEVVSKISEHMRRYNNDE